MKLSLLAFLFSACILSLSAQISDSADMHAGYTSEVFYSFPNQTKTSVSFSTWDIGFQTTLMDASVISNDNSVQVYLAPGVDSNDYATLDVSGYAGWDPLYNSDTSWNLGSFNTGENLATWDFGWGVYDYSVTHTVYGNKLFAIEKGGDVYKFWIRKKTATGDYLVRYANVTAGGPDVDVTLNAAAYGTKNFVYLNLDDQTLLDVEPDICCWQILFTHYLANIPYAGYYPVTGVFSAPGVTVAKAFPVDIDMDSFQLHQNEFATSLSAIGYDWKFYDIYTMEYVLEDSLIYYVKSAEDYIWSLQFTGFDSGNGITYFNQELVYDPTIGIKDIDGSLTNAVVYPNPAAENVTLLFDAKKNSTVGISIFDVTGKNVLQTSMKASAGFNSRMLSLPPMSNGVYHLVLNEGSQNVNLKLLVAQ